MMRRAWSTRGVDGRAMREVLIEIARAKVNLTLRVLGRRPDGNHELESLVAFADVGDVVEFLPGVPPSVTVVGSFATAIDGPNIAMRALELAREAAPRLVLGAVTIDKRLPVAAGIGGGSADAAAVLRAIRRANPDLAPTVDWHAIASALGADVPVCLDSAAQFMWGTGRQTREVPALPRLPVVLANPGVPLSTATVFRALAAAPVVPANDSPPSPGPFADAEVLLTHMRVCGNDLEPPAIAQCPAVGMVLDALRAASGVRLARMSGSGPTCFAVFDRLSDAEDVAAEIRRAAPSWWVVPASLGLR